MANLLKEAQQYCDIFRRRWVRNDSNEMAEKFKMNISTPGCDDARSEHNKFNVSQKTVFSKLVSTSPEEHFQCLFGIKFFWTSCHKFFARLSELHPTRPEEHFQDQKTHVFNCFWTLRKNIWDFWQNKYRQGCQSCFLRVQRNVLKNFF